MAELIAIPLKKPSDVDVVKPLTNVVKSTYSGPGNQKDYSDAIAELGKLRNNALWRAFEKYESSLEVIYGYESASQDYYYTTERNTCDGCVLICRRIHISSAISSRTMETAVGCLPPLVNVSRLFSLLVSPSFCYI